VLWQPANAASWIEDHGALVSPSIGISGFDDLADDQDGIEVASKIK
jgi:hypothetical protein